MEADILQTAGTLDQICYHRGPAHALLGSPCQDIVHGRFQKRPFPIEPEIGRTPGVSRCDARGALKMLVAKGVIRTRTRSGSTVTPSSGWNLFDPDVLRWLLKRAFPIERQRHIMQFRLAIEPEAAALAARWRTQRDMEVIEGASGAVRPVEAGGSDPLEAAIDFHVAILSATGNPSPAASCRG